MTRQELIDCILKDLKNLKEDPSFENQYAVDENIKFFESLRTLPFYIRWLLKTARRLDKEKLLELIDLPFPQWEREMQVRLVNLEKKRFPGLISPLVNRVVEFVIKENRELLLVSLGCGGMEVERQVIKKLFGLDYKKRITFVGIDRSIVAHQIAKENLKEIETNIYIHEVKNLDQLTLKKILEMRNTEHIVILCNNDIFTLNKYFENKSFDLVYHSLFKHHLSEIQKYEVDNVVKAISKNYLEYDGYHSWIHLIPQTIEAWGYPVFLNGSIFSNFRYPRRRDLDKMGKLGVMKIYKIGTYLLEHSMQTDK